MREVSVTTFAPPMVVTSPFGLVHIWTGGYTNVSLP